MTAIPGPDRALPSPGPPPADGDLRLAYDAIQAELYEDAHRLLLALAKRQPHDPHVWHLLGWTAPTRTAAITYFKRMQRLAPDNPLAQDGLVWSQHEWSSLRQPSIATKATSSHSQTTSISVNSRWRRLSFPACLALYLLGIAVAETVTTFFHPQLGLVIHGALLALIILHASLAARPDQQKFLITLALAPIIRLLSLSMPLLEFQYVYWYMVIGAPLLLSTLLVLRLTGYTPSQVGLTLGSGLTLQIGVALTGLGFGYLEYQILKPEPLVESFSLQNIWLPALILLVFTGFLEELIFRGLMQRASMATIKKLGPLYISVLFAVLHIGYRSLIDFVFVFLVGFFFSLVAERTRSILGVTLAHGLTNIALFLIFPFFSIPS